MQAAAGMKPDRSVPIYAVAVSAALLVVVALLIALQPPSGSSVAGGPVLSWMRALLFAGGLAFFALGMAGFARSPGSDRGGMYEQDDDVHGYATPAAAYEAPEQEPEVVRGVGAPRVQPIAPATSYTVISFSRATGEPMAIADFDDPDELSAALVEWGWQHPDENIHVFNERGVEVARVPVAVAGPGRSERRVTHGRPVPAAVAGRFARIPA